MSSRRIPSNHLPKVLRLVRTARGLTQEDFGLVSSRTYMSGLERGIKNPTLKKVDEIASVMEVHPLTLLTLAYAESTEVKDVRELLHVVQQQVVNLRKQGV
jgi:transcriptional regulator with XRE-family HTH domain